MLMWVGVKSVLLHHFSVRGELGGNLLRESVKVFRRHQRKRCRRIEAENGPHVLSNVAPITPIALFRLLPEQDRDAVLTQIPYGFWCVVLVNARRFT